MTYAPEQSTMRPRAKLRCRTFITVGTGVGHCQPKKYWNLLRKLYYWVPLGGDPAHSEGGIEILSNAGLRLWRRGASCAMPEP